LKRNKQFVATIEQELALKHKYDMDRVQAETKARAQAERENRDIHMEQLRANAQERRQTIIESITTGGSILGTGALAFISDWQKITATV
jgi:ATPase family AAA domain-containing protein 3A/B